MLVMELILVICFMVRINSIKDLGNWDVSAGTDFGGMFVLTKAFNKDISIWNVRFRLQKYVPKRNMFSKI